MSLPLPLEPGTLLDGRYIVGALINSGGFGAVYCGVDMSEDNRSYAIKETYDVSPSARRQALMEAGVLFTVRSKHLPEVYDAFEANARFYLVMQLVEGENLQQLLKVRGYPCSEEQVVRWLLPMMQVLQELHSRTPAIMHRDIKPSNIILTPSEVAVLVDFGLTRLYDPNSSTQTMVRAVSEGFSPIEQYMGKTSPQSDIYALAATMYCLLTGKVPPLAISRSMGEVLLAPRSLNPLLSPKIERVLLKALEMNPDQRYQSMREFAQALQEPSFSGYADPTIAMAAKAVPSSGFVGLPRPSGSSGNVGSPSLAPPPPPGQRPPLLGNARQTASLQPEASQASLPNPAPAGAMNRGYDGTNGPGVRGPAPRAATRAFTPPQTTSAPTVPPGYVLVPRSTLETPRSLPSSTGQGCLWGLLQGVLAAVMLLILKKEVYFYVAIAMGFLFYLLAGFFTTHKGGSLWRGGGAGFWSWITSTVMFWIVLIVGLLVLVVQRLQADTLTAHRRGVPLPPDELGRALRLVAPVVPGNPTAQSPAVALLILLVAGVALAIGFGLLGGLLGKLEFEDRVGKRGSKISGF